jgi:hypothetical protein
MTTGEGLIALVFAAAIGIAAFWAGYARASHRDGRAPDPDWAAPSPIGPTGRSLEPEIRGEVPLRVLRRWWLAAYWRTHAMEAAYWREMRDRVKTGHGRR